MLSQLALAPVNKVLLSWWCARFSGPYAQLLLSAMKSSGWYVCFIFNILSCGCFHTLPLQDLFILGETIRFNNSKSDL